MNHRALADEDCLPRFRRRDVVLVLSAPRQSGFFFGDRARVDEVIGRCSTRDPKSNRYRVVRLGNRPVEWWFYENELERAA